MNAPRHGLRAMPRVVVVLLALATAAFGFAVGYGVAGLTPADPGATPGGAAVGTRAPVATAPIRSGGTGPAYAVRADGDDAATGGPASPWRTLAHALAAVPPGSTILLGPGTFDAAAVTIRGTRIVGEGEASVISGGLVVEADGVEISYVTITGQADAHAGGITVDRARDVVISNATVRGNPFGVYLVGARGARIVDNRITDNAYGLEIHGVTDGTLVSGNEIVDNDRPLDASRGAGGLNLYFTTGGITIAGNRIEDNDEVAIEIYGASDLEISANRVSGSNDMIETGTEAAAPCRNIAIRGNTFYNARPDDAGEERGVYLRCASDTTVEWNTFAGLDRFAIGLFAGEGGFNGPLDGVSIRHNILAGGRAYSLDSRLAAGVVIDDNVVMPCRTGACPILGRDVAYVAAANAGTRIWSEFQAWTGFEANGSFGDPRFVDAAAHDYRLAAGSAAAGRAGATEAPGTPAASDAPSPTPTG